MSTDTEEIEGSRIQERMSQWKNEDGSWNRSAIMRRGHEIAKQMNDDRLYRDRLSESLSRVWAEAKDEQDPDIVVDVPARTWQDDVPEPSEPEMESRETEVAKYHAAALPEGGMKGITAGEAKRRLEIMSCIDVERTDQGWKVEVEWRGHTLVGEQTYSYEEAADYCRNLAWEIAKNKDLLYQAAEKIGEEEAISQFREVQRSHRSYEPNCGSEDDFIFVDASTRGKEIVHLDLYETDGLAGAIRSLYRQGVTRKNLEVWIVPGSYWGEMTEGEFGIGESPSVGDDLLPNLLGHEQPYDEWDPESEARQSEGSGKDRGPKRPDGPPRPPGQDGPKRSRQSRRPTSTNAGFPPSANAGPPPSS